MVNAIGSLDLRPDPLRRALYRAYQKKPRAIKVPLEMWSNDITYGRLIDAAEKAGDRKKTADRWRNLSVGCSVCDE